MHRHSTALNTWAWRQAKKKLTPTPHPTPKPANPACKTAIRHPRRRVPERKTKNRRQSGCRLWRVSPVEAISSESPCNSFFCSILRAPHRGTSLGPFVCGANNF